MLAARDLPNLLTAMRMLLVGPLVYLLLEGAYAWALALALITGLSDWLDGALARRFQWQSRFGGVLDPLADKLLMVAVYAALAWLGHLPAWLFALVVIRDAVIVAGGAIYHYRIEKLEPEPTRFSKFNTLCQILLMWVVLTALAGLAVPRWVVDGLIWVVTLTVAATLVQYVIVWSLRARRAVHGH